MYKMISYIQNIPLLGLSTKIILASCSLLAFILDIVFAIFFFVKYIKSQKKNQTFLYISLVLFFVYWTRLPFALNLLGFPWIVNQIYWIFSIVLPLYLIALIFIILVLRSLCPLLCQKRLFIFFHAWAIVALMAMSYYFLYYKGIFSDYLPVKTMYYIFIFPARIIIFLVGLYSIFNKQMNLLKIQKIGILILLVNNLLGTAVNYFNYYSMMHLPPEFWFVPVAGYSIGYIWELINSILLITAFLLLTKKQNTA